jgi:hypothetical protein
MGERKRTVPRKTKDEHACSVVSRCNLLRKKNQRRVGGRGGWGKKTKRDKVWGFEGKMVKMVKI